MEDRTAKMRLAEFVEKLAALCTEYCAGMHYTKDDDGIIVYIGRESVSIGWPAPPCPGADIREHVKKELGGHFVQIETNGTRGHSVVRRSNDNAETTEE